METEWIYQYISLNQDPEKIIRIIDKVSRHSILPVLDVEDSLQIPLNDKRTLELKLRARNCLKDVINILNLNKKDYSLCLRVNAVESPEFIKDLKVLNKLNNKVVWDSLFIPKVHSGFVLNSYLDNLYGINFNEIVVMIESQDGMNNLNEIMKVAKANHVTKIHFGHWDYFYDIEEFPVPLHVSERFWKIASDIINRIESNNLHYIHTPFSDIMNHPVFISIIALLEKKTNLKLGVTTLSFIQGLVIRNSNGNNKKLIPIPINYNEAQKNEEAIKIINLFNRSDDIEFSFHIDKKDYKFYAPHEYLNALNYLSKKNGKNEV